MKLRSIIKKGLGFVVCASAAIFLAACTFSVAPYYNTNKPNPPDAAGTPAQITNRDDLKVKAIEQVKTLHRLMEERKFEEVYKMIDEKIANETSERAGSK